MEVKTSVIAHNNFIELLALKTEVDGMVAENKCREVLDQSPAYTEISFQIVADKMRALKITD